MSKKTSRSAVFGIAISVAALCFVFVFIHQRLRQYHYHEVSQAFHSIPQANIWWAIGLTFISYFVLTFYDFMAIKYVGHSIKYARISISSFISYAFSNNMGHPLITGAIRYRLYSAWGLGAFDVAKVVAFCTFTLWLGFLFLTGLMFSIAPMPVPPGLQLSFLSLRVIGVVFLLIVGAYFALIHWKTGELKIRKWSFSLPKPSMGIAQLLISSFDWIIAASVLYVLLPGGNQISYFTLISFFLLAQFVGVISQVPGGLGVFEATMLLLLGSTFPALQILGTLMAYRVVYYILPLGLATALFSGEELVRQKKYLFKAVKSYDNIVGPLAPQIFSIISFLGGVILLFSNATPSLRQRLLAVHEFVPVPVIEISHFFASIIGIALLFLARGLQRRLNSAYYLTIVAMTAGIFVSIFKGHDYEEALTLGLMLLALIPCQKHFYRKSHLIDQPFSVAWLLSITVALGSTIWLGFFSYKHIQYSTELWWQFSLHGDASRFLRMLVAIVGFISLYSILRLFRSYHPAADASPSPDVIESIIRQSSHTNSNLAFLGDKRFFINKQQTALIMYAVEGKSWVVMGDPIGKKEDVQELAWQFREYCDQHGGRAIFYEVSSGNLDLYLDMGLSLIKIGETARVNLPTFNLADPANKRRRQTINHVESRGYSFNIINQTDLPSLLPRIKHISDAWLSDKRTKEKGFSLGFYSPEYISLFPMGVVQKDNEIIAFANLWLTERKDEISVDLMRYLPATESKVMEYLFIQVMLWGKANAYQWFDLGIAPFSGMQNRALAPLWHRLGSLIFKYGNHFYQLQGLRQYKDKFNPVWEPVYIATPSGLALPETLINLISLISSGYKKALPP
ncbi:MAG: bifunctional lysylphosphatidylglycerol flippase/synthetase MprF [Candidatus Cloacimonadaceae bacterium]|nr:bifunctional lysylphosphatidylglycerol flippase/synthetase MprF [Candidatus Cloacimonadaceae bacterium]